MRTVIVGGPRTGKTTLARKLVEAQGVVGISTDDYMSLPWADVPDAVVTRLSRLNDFVLEGVQAARVLRRWYISDESAPQIDRVICLWRTVAPVNRGQAAMGKGIQTVFAEVMPLLHASGVEVVDGVPEELR